MYLFEKKSSFSTVFAVATDESSILIFKPISSIAFKVFDNIAGARENENFDVSRYVCVPYPAY